MVGTRKNRLGDGYGHRPDLLYDPMLLLLLVGGVAVDRFHRIRLMLASDLSRGVAVGIIALLAFTQRLELWQLCTMSAFFGLVGAFFYPASTAAIPDLVPTEHLLSANSLRRISLQVAQVFGPGIGAAIIALGGTPLAFALDGASFVISAACLLALPGKPARRNSSSKERTSPLHDLRAGIGTVLQSPWLWVTIAAACVSTIFLSGPMRQYCPCW